MSKFALFFSFCFLFISASVFAKTAVIQTTAGDIKVKLFEDKAPETVKNFVGLAKGEREWVDPKTKKKVKGRSLYDGTIFHRVIKDFMIQGGDPEGTGMGGPGYTFPDEFKPDLRFNRPGLLAMANAGPGTNGSQFFITTVPTPHLNDRHTIFGAIDPDDKKSMKVVDKIISAKTNSENRPLKPEKIKKIKIID
ncbi:MAG: peptidylprolyl isomerase [Bdellovibrionota bacterium]